MLLTLLLALPLQGIAHAPLHPADADVFLEIASPKELFAARTRAPFNQLFADEDVQKLCALLEGFKLPVQAVGDAAFPPALFSDTSPWRALQHASFSLRGIDGAGAETHFGIEGILDFPDAASAGAALAAFDEWKNLAHPTDAALAKECKLGEHSCVLHWYEANLATQNARFWLAQDQARVYLGALETTAEQISARLSGKEAGLAPESKLFAGAEALGPASGTPLYQLWCDIEFKSALGALTSRDTSGVGRLLAHWMLPVVVPYVGAQGIWRVEMRGERFVSDALYKQHEGFENKAFGTGAIDATAARYVPKEAVSVWLTNIDGAQFEQELRGVLAAAPAPGTTAAVDPLAGLPPLSAGLGTHAAVYMLPLNNVQSFVPRLFLAVELKDKAKFEAGLHAWAAKLAELDPNAKVADKEYRKFASVSVSFAKEQEPSAQRGNALGALGGGDTNVTPTIVVLDDRVLVALKKEHAQSETRRVADGKNAEPHAIASADAFQKDAFEASEIDWAGLVGKLLDIAKGLAPMAANALGPDAPPIDAAALPGSKTLARHIKPSTSWSKRLPDGRIHTHAESSLGPETPVQILLFVSAASAALKERTTGVVAGQVAPRKEAPAADTGPTDNLVLETKAALLRVKSGIAVYKIEFKKLPASLEELLAPSPNYPDGFLAPEKSLPQDGWKHALAYKPDADGKRFQLYSFGPDGKDDAGAGDDLKAP